MKLGVKANLNKENAADVLRGLQTKALELGITLYSSSDECSILTEAICVTDDSLAEQVDVMMALGGDGTMLQAVRQLGDVDIPIMGVNIGSLGFLTSVAQDQMCEALTALANGQCESSQRTLAHCTVFQKNTNTCNARALNDVVIGWGCSSRIVTLELKINDQKTACFKCDGLIFSTPTGSTGHSMSAGGPILCPESPVFLLNTICPHTLSNRPLVIPDDSTVDITVRAASKELILSADGQDIKHLNEGDSVRINKYRHGIRLLNLPGTNYFSVLRKKLHWRGSSV